MCFVYVRVCVCVCFTAMWNSHSFIERIEMIVTSKLSYLKLTKLLWKVVINFQPEKFTYFFSHGYSICVSSWVWVAIELNLISYRCSEQQFRQIFGLDDRISSHLMIWVECSSSAEYCWLCAQINRCWASANESSESKSKLLMSLLFGIFSHFISLAKAIYSLNSFERNHHEQTNIVEEKRERNAQRESEKEIKNINEII